MTDFKKRIQDPRRMRAMKTRTVVEASIREYFLNQGFLETRTPLLVASPGMETHIRPLELQSHSKDRVFLPTSPEFAMKKLLSGGLEKIFQIAPVFRSEPPSSTHHPEFTMLEWYRAHCGEEEIQSDVENIFILISEKLNLKKKLQFQGREIDLSQPWPRKTVRELFFEFASIDIGQASRSDLEECCKKFSLSTSPSDTWEDLYFKIWLNQIEPRLPQDRPVFVTRYPATQAALSLIETQADGTAWAKRFEVYLGGVELANAFEELTDPVEQRKRFEADMKTRFEVYGESFPPNPIDEEFMDALNQGMPQSSGIALGVDRLVMLFADESDIDYTLWLKSFWPSSS